MRSRERLVEVLKTVNRNAPGTDPYWCALFHAAAIDLEAFDLKSIAPGIRHELRRFLGESGQSPHFRELAKELLDVGAGFAERIELDRLIEQNRG